MIGGGPNGLAAALTLAQARRKVVLVERRTMVGGLSGAIEFHPGYRAPGILHDTGLVSPRIAGSLGLAQHGLAFVEAAPVLMVGTEGPGVVAPHDLNGRDLAAYAAYRAFFTRLAPVVERVMTEPPPTLSPATAGDFSALARQTMRFWRLGKRDTLELLRAAPMCAADFLNERFESPLVVEGLAAQAVVGAFAGPWSAGTTANLILAEAAPGRRIAGGPPALVAALEHAARSAGVDIRTHAGVERILVDDRPTIRVAGVRLDDGTTLDAPVVVATCDPKQAMLDLVEPGVLPVRVEQEFRHVRARGTAAKVHLALSGLFELAARPGERLAAIRVGGGHVDALERAFDAVKYRQMSARPHLEIRVPTVEDPTLAPAGCDVVSMLVSYTPFDLEGGWTAARSTALLESVLAALDPHAPSLRSRIVASQVLSPADLAREYALTGGQVHHVEPALDQLLFMRPSPSAARYATPVAGLFLGGSGSHGGGGVGCAAGYLASRAVLRTG